MFMYGVCYILSTRYMTLIIIYIQQCSYRGTRLLCKPTNLYASWSYYYGYTLICMNYCNYIIIGCICMLFVIYYQQFVCISLLYIYNNAYIVIPYWYINPTIHIYSLAMLLCICNTTYMNYCFSITVGCICMLFVM